MKYNRGEIVDQNFIERVKLGELPSPKSSWNLRSVGLSLSVLVDLFETQILTRHLDLRARKMKASNDCYYTIGSAGHEGNAVFGKVFRFDDMAFLHYRSGAFFIQRAKQVPGETPLYDLLLSLTASTEDPISGGRHKVFGSRSLFIPPQTSTIASHLPKAVGTAFSIGRARDLKLPSLLPHDSLVLCSFGDASSNHSTAQGAFNTAAWMVHQNIPLPLLFICEDNGLGISVPTDPQWVQNSVGHRKGLKYFSCDGRDLADLYKVTLEAESYVRRLGRPAFIHMKTARLLGHAGSDVESLYRSFHHIEETEREDPLLYSAQRVLSEGVLSQEEVINLYEQTRSRVYHVSQEICERLKVKGREEAWEEENSLIQESRWEKQNIHKNLVACDHPRLSPEVATSENRQRVFGKAFSQMTEPTHMAKLLNWALRDLLLRYPEILIFGEDVAQKGGVYHVTDGLSKTFGSRRVFNSLLDETSILGTAMGLGHNGFLPMPEIQFLAYIHNAEDQLRGEAATLAYFSRGQFTNPMVVRVAGLGYQKGFGGHYHNENSLALFRDVPGLLLAVPSNGLDAVRMLRACVKEAYEKGRVVVFVEPIALYMTKDLIVEGDRGWSFVYPLSDEEEMSLGEPGVLGEGSDLVLLSYGNGAYFCHQAAQVLQEKYGLSVRVIDLRWLHPLYWDPILAAVQTGGRILIVDECRKTASLSEELVAGLVERLTPLPQIKVLAAEDNLIPLGPKAAADLPNKEKVIQESLSLLGVSEEVHFQVATVSQATSFTNSPRYSRSEASSQSTGSLEAAESTESSKISKSSKPSQSVELPNSQASSKGSSSSEPSQKKDSLRGKLTSFKEQVKGISRGDK